MLCRQVRNRVDSLRWRLRCHRMRIREMADHLRAKVRLDAAVYGRADISPIDRYIALQVATRRDGLFHPSYHSWRATRINKLLEVYGVDWFAGKRLLELGCGHADLGAFFAEIGAKVLSVDGRKENVNFAKLKHRRMRNLQIEVADLDTEFPQFDHYDLVLHFGLLYHLSDVDSHLKQCWDLANEIMLETVVCDLIDPDYIVYFAGNRLINEESLSGVQNRPSPSYIERLACVAGFEIDRYFTRDLNSGLFTYDWVHKNNGDLGGWYQRRMWRFHKRGMKADPA
jgi:2-polyprenyl-3-methyl-5-hydroxy-6-metoxy-1,4-benzoquinol methylase